MATAVAVIMELRPATLPVRIIPPTLLAVSVAFTGLRRVVGSGANMAAVVPEVAIPVPKKLYADCPPSCVKYL
jgi:hypothetical protein